MWQERWICDLNSLYIDVIFAFFAQLQSLYSIPASNLILSNTWIHKKFSKQTLSQNPKRNQQIWPPQQSGGIIITVYFLFFVGPTCTFIAIVLFITSTTFECECNVYFQRASELLDGPWMFLGQLPSQNTHGCQSQVQLLVKQNKPLILFLFFMTASW